MRCPSRTAVLTALCVGASMLAVTPLVAQVKGSKRPETTEIVNFALGFDYSHWLVGPIYYIADARERAGYLALTDDAAAEAFIEAFWKKRNPGLDIFGNEVRRIYDERIAAADVRFREGAMMGRRTDRGALFVVYGEPENVEYELGTRRNEPDLEVWVYAEDAPAGLDGQTPRRRYWFAEKDGRKVFHTPRAGRRRNSGGGR